MFSSLHTSFGRLQLILIAPTANRAIDSLDGQFCIPSDQLLQYHQTSLVRVPHFCRLPLLLTVATFFVRVGLVGERRTNWVRPYGDIVHIILVSVVLNMGASDQLGQTVRSSVFSTTHFLIWGITFSSELRFWDLRLFGKLIKSSTAFN
jgi:hypothetical protein